MYQLDSSGVWVLSLFSKLFSKVCKLSCKGLDVSVSSVVTERSLRPLLVECESCTDCWEQRCVTGPDRA